MPRRTDPWPALALLGFLAVSLLAAVSGLLPFGPRTGSGRPFPHPAPGQLPGGAAVLLAAVVLLPTGVGAWMVWCRSPNGWPRIGGGGSLEERAALRRRALQLWGWMLCFCVCWSTTFLLLHRLGPAVMSCAGTIGLAVLAMRDFIRVHRAAGLLIAPCLGWLCYVAWITVGTALSNPF
ncbi:MAG: tryptophan-rich sensory protein [Gluconacetobacter diazotrophicus]|nr:tryptophan-rich sensory protein [Gluconacetobacter diazotrophicus]